MKLGWRRLQGGRRGEMKIQIHLPLLAPGKEEGSLRKVKDLENSRDGTRVGSNFTTRSTKCCTSKGVMYRWWSLTRNWKHGSWKVRIQVPVHGQMMMRMIVRMRLQPTTLFARGGHWRRWDKWANKLNFRPGRMNGGIQEVTLECIVYGWNRYTLPAFGWHALGTLIGIRIAFLVCILMHGW